MLEFMNTKEQLQKAKKAARLMSKVSDKQTRHVLLDLAERAEKSSEKLLGAN